MMDAPLSYAQERLWVGHQLSAQPWTYHLPITLRLRGTLDVPALHGAVTALVVRHQVLRTAFVSTRHGPRQSVVPARIVAMPVVEVRDPPTSGSTGAVAEQIRRAHRTPLDLTAGVGLRALLLRLADDEHVLCLTTHLLCVDEDSVPSMIRELFAEYCGGEPPVPRRREGDNATFIGFALAERQQRTDAALAPHLAYWAETLAGGEPPDLPSDRQRPRRSANVAERAVHRFPVAAVTPRSDAIGTPAEVVRAGVLAVLAAYTGQEDLLVGTSRALPRGCAPAQWLGPFTEQVVVRADLRGDPSFAEAVRRCHTAFHNADQHGEAPIDVVRRQVPGRWRWPRMTVDIGHPVPTVPEVPGLQVERLDPEPVAARMDLAVVVTCLDDDVVLTAEYDAELFDRSRIERLLRHVEVLSRAGAEDATRRLSTLPLLTAPELADILDGWQGPVVPYPREPVHQQVHAQAVRRPDAVALQLDDERMTYAELDRRVDLLARRLRAEGIGRDDIVAICLDRGFDAIVAMLGIMRAGGAFAVLDPTHPKHRLAFILTDTAARVVLTRAALHDRLPEPAGWVAIHTDTDWADIEREPVTGPLTELADEHSLAYVLYTSGSTGQPKGALIEHGSLSNFVLWPRWLFNLGPHDRMLQHMALVFDFSEGEIFTALTCGATLVLLPDRVRTSPEALGRLIAGERITCAFGPPAVFNNVDLGPCPDLRYIVVGGDVCTGDLVTRWNAPGRRFVNGYGPTEATVGCTAYECEHRRWHSPPPIGRGMPNRLTYILDGAMRPCPVGVAGELYIGGVGLARGYLNRPDLTRDRFLPDPFRPGQRIYRTGDLCNWTPDGQIAFLGRIDTQVKVNGLRVELEEIEVALTAQPEIEHAAVIAYRETTGSSRLIAHVVTATGEVDADDLRNRLAEQLPSNLVPGQYVPLATLPLTIAGKVDRAALASLHDGRTAGESTFHPPRTPVERQIAGLVADVLAGPPVGVYDDLRDLGASSLDLITIAAAVNDAFDAGLVPLDVYEEPTIAAMSRLVARVHDDAATRTTLALLTQVEDMTSDEVVLLTTRPGPAAA
jgi:amino acid adenylation domain-containing protein